MRQDQLSLSAGVDLDGVVYCFTEAMARYIHETTGRPLDELGPATCWEFYEDWGYTLAEFLHFFEDGANARCIFLEGEPMPGALPAIGALKSAGHTIHVEAWKQVDFQWQQVELPA
jgi:hypothetical protein